MSPALVIALAYLLGSIPFGYLIVRLRGRGDVRQTGSGGTGATNVTRSAGRWAGLLTLALDALKGTLAIVLARSLLADSPGINWTIAAAGVAAIVGHCFPVWLKFRGGKGVATGLGVFLVLAPLVVGIVAVIFVLIVWRTRYVSLGSITAAAAVPLCVWLLEHTAAIQARSAPLITVALIGSALIIFMHRANISRLLSGTENRWKG
ncbi:MAG: glycerol-3-phosphate 1-O-acyltransferase PlsY [Pyrinomonadaceae bacterium]